MWPLPYKMRKDGNECDMRGWPCICRGEREISCEAGYDDGGLLLDLLSLT